ncbi:MAG TPA: hypothetical protein VE076_10495 [Nitrososphaeraceae archaeon]|nr:hypothetical protein [Nitrososphaeraceae archaeon]
MFGFVRKRFNFINYFLIMVIRQIMTMTNLSIKNDAVVVRRWIVNKIKTKISIITDAISLGKYIKSTYEVNANNTENDFNIIVEEERYSCWFVLFIDYEVKIEAKIIHKGRGKFKIVEDRYGGKYINKIVDASDVIRCTEIP